MALPLAAGEVPVPDDDYMPGPPSVADFTCPPYVPPLLALVSCVVSGVTTFGDGIAFLVGWGLLTTAGVLPAHPASYAKAVAYITLLPLTSLPALLWTARKELRRSVGYATVMSITTAAFTPAGSYVLLFGAADVVSALIGAFFLLFATLKMQGSVVDLGKARLHRRELAAAAATAEAAEHGGAGAAAPPVPVQLLQQLPAAAAAEAPPGATKQAPPAVDVEAGGAESPATDAPSAAAAPPSPPVPRQLSTQGALLGTTDSSTDASSTKRASLVLDQLRLPQQLHLHGGTAVARTAVSGADVDGALSLGPPAAVVASQQLGLRPSDSGSGGSSPCDDAGASSATSSPVSTGRGGADCGDHDTGFGGGGGGGSCSSSTTFAPSEPGSGSGNTPMLAAAHASVAVHASQLQPHPRHHHSVHRPSPLATAHAVAATASAAVPVPSASSAPLQPLAPQPAVAPAAASTGAATLVDAHVRRLRIKLALGRAMGVSTPVLASMAQGGQFMAGGDTHLGADDGGTSGGSSAQGSPTLAPLLLPAHRQRLSTGARSAGTPSPLSRAAADGTVGAAAGFAPPATALQQRRPAAVDADSARAAPSSRGVVVAAALQRSGTSSSAADAAATGPSWGTGKAAHPHADAKAPPAVATCTARAATALDAAFPPVSATYSRVATGWILAATGVASGVLGGVIGSGGPPQMVAFAELKLRKDSIRGIKVLATTVANAVRLLTMAAVGGSRIFRADEWPVYVGVAGASIFGTFLGSWLRDFCDGESILRGLYVLLFVTAAIMFDALDSLPTGLGFAGGGLAWGALIAVTYLHPHEVAAGQRAVTSALRTALCCGCLRRAAPAAPQLPPAGTVASGKAAK
jgi:uncharacterized membrane protein YfcA